MIRLYRQPLETKWQIYLTKWETETLDASIGETPRKSWKSRRRTRTIAHVIETLKRMNGDSDRCIYCESNEANHLDHFKPINLDTSGTFRWPNLIWSCDLCNTKHKRDKFLGPGEERPIDPTFDTPEDHLTVLSTGLFRKKTPRGTWTVALCDLEREALCTGRSDRWVTLSSTIVAYDGCKFDGDSAKADRLERLIRRRRHRAVLRDLVAAATSPSFKVLDLESVRDALDARPEIRGWATEPHAPTGP